MFLVFEALTKELGTTLKFWRCVLYCFVLFYDVLYYVLYCFMQGSCTSSIVTQCSFFFTIFHSWNMLEPGQAMDQFGSLLPGPTSGGYTESRAGDLESWMWPLEPGRPGSNQRPGAWRFGSYSDTIWIIWTIMIFLWYSHYIPIYLDHFGFMWWWPGDVWSLNCDAWCPWCLRNHSLNCYIRCSSL